MNFVFKIFMNSSSSSLSKNKSNNIKRKHYERIDTSITGDVNFNEEKIKMIINFFTLMSFLY